jgi:hypothetical protein
MPAQNALSNNTKSRFNLTLNSFQKEYRDKHTGIRIAKPFTCLVCLKLYSSKALNRITLAGLLTYSILETPFPFLAKQWFEYGSTTFGGAYSSESVQDSHLIPFSMRRPQGRRHHQNAGQRYT